MSWLARSIANTLKFDESDDNESKDDDRPDSRSPATPLDPNADPSSPRGVKDDLSEISKTLTRQFWGVASFLAPPPPPLPEPLEGSEAIKPDPDSGPEPVGILGIRNDFAEIGGKFRTGISMISSNMNVSEITKMASNFLQLESDNEEDGAEGDKSVRGAIGVTNDVVSFARDIAMHPETWLDFPLPDDEDEDYDFEMSDAQQEHALAVEHLAPRLAALRMELCPGYMSDANFWKIYFVLLHPRLVKEDAVVLSTSQIVKARANLSIELQKSSKTKDSEGVGLKDNSYSQNEASLSVPSSTGQDKVPITSPVEPTSSTIAAEEDTEKHPVRSIEISETVEQGKDQTLQIDSAEENEDDNDDWLKEEENTEVAGVSGSTVPVEDEEDVSFSDLEEDDEDVPASSKKASANPDKESRDWVQL